MNDAGRLAADLLHDVGKYLARTARNVGERSIDAVLADMLARDAYETHRGRRASARFAEVAEQLEALGVRHPSLATARAALARIDALEPGVRSKEPAALHSLVTLAVEAEGALRALAVSTRRVGEAER